MAAEKDVQTSPAGDKEKITLYFIKPHEMHKTDEKGNAVVKKYQPGDRDKFTQEDADTIRALRVAQKILNP